VNPGDAYQALLASLVGSGMAMATTSSRTPWPPGRKGRTTSLPRMRRARVTSRMKQRMTPRMTK
jgi:hypothetical protein